MGRVIDMIVGLNAILGVAGFMGWRLSQRRHPSPLEHVRQLEQESEEIDDLIARIRKGND